MNIQKEVSRRDFLKGTTLLIPAWLIAACNFAARTPTPPNVSPTKAEIGVIPNLDLKIDEAGFWSVVRGRARFATLPDATDKSKLLPYSQNIYMGRSSNLFRVAINRPMADFLINQSKLLNPPPSYQYNFC